jgi:hypothetical protein
MKQESTLRSMNVSRSSQRETWVGDKLQSSATGSDLAYHELAEVPVRQIDLLDAVEENVQLLEELQARLGFMVREVKYLLKL